MVGLVEICAEDCLPTVQPSIHTESYGNFICNVYRVRPAGETEWLIVDSGEPIQIDCRTIKMRQAEFDSFETEYVRPPTIAQRDKYDWDGIYQFICLRIFEEGITETLIQLIHEVQDWCMRRSDGKDMPDESTLRKRLRPLYKSLKGSMDEEPTVSPPLLEHAATQSPQPD